MWMVTVVVGLYSAFSVFFSRVGFSSVQSTVGREVHQFTWMLALGLLPSSSHFHSFSSSSSFKLLFCFAACLSAFICCRRLPSRFPSDVGFRGSRRTWCKHTAFILLINILSCVCVCPSCVCVCPQDVLARSVHSASRGKPPLHQLGQNLALGAVYFPGHGARRGRWERVGGRTVWLHL